MLNITIDTANLTRMKNAFGQIQSYTRSDIDEMCLSITDTIAVILKNEAPEDTGYLRDNIVVVKNGPFDYSVISKAWYTKFVLFGAAPHIVMAGRVSPPDPNHGRDYRGSIGISTSYPQRYLSWPGSPPRVQFVAHGQRDAIDFIGSANYSQAFRDFPPKFINHVNVAIDTGRYVQGNY